MGVDIHMSIVKDKEILAKDIFDGRNSEWFNNLQGRGWDSEYDKLPISTGFPENCSERLVKYKDIFGYYGFYYISVKDFCEWFLKYRPDIDAGWVSTYDKWRIEKKGYIPEDPQHYLDKEDNVNDMHWVEFENIYDCSKWLFDYLVSNKIPDDANIVYFFDH